MHISPFPCISTSTGRKCWSTLILQKLDKNYNNFVSPVRQILLSRLCRYCYHRWRALRVFVLESFFSLAFRQIVSENSPKNLARCTQKEGRQKKKKKERIGLNCQIIVGFVILGRRLLRIPRRIHVWRSACWKNCSKRLGGVEVIEWNFSFTWYTNL